MAITKIPDCLGCCHSLDYNFGRVVRALKDKGIYDQTMLIYASDHGNHFRTLLSEKSPNGGTDDYKRTSFENTIHVPLIIKGKSFSGGKVEDKLVSLIDLPKTIMTAAGCRIEERVQGDALQNIFTDPHWKEEVYVQISESFVGRAVRTERYKYVIHAPDLNPWESMTTDIWQEKCLFDLGKDPLEKHNLLDDPDYASIKEDMKSRLVRCAKKAGENIVSILPAKRQ